MKEYGHIKISRKMFDGADEYWEEKRPRTKAEAWIDLIQMANWKEGKVLAGNHSVCLERGEFLASFRYLAFRWKWSVNKSKLFLKSIENKGRIKVHQKTPIGYTYLIVNYDSYQ